MEDLLKAWSRGVRFIRFSWVLVFVFIFFWFPRNFEDSKLGGLRYLLFETDSNATASLRVGECLSFVRSQGVWVSSRACCVPEISQAAANIKFVGIHLHGINESVRSGEIPTTNQPVYPPSILINHPIQPQRSLQHITPKPKETNPNTNQGP